MLYKEQHKLVHLVGYIIIIIYNVCHKQRLNIYELSHARILLLSHAKRLFLGSLLL